MFEWARYTLRRLAMLPMTWVLAHVAVFFWKALDPNYIRYTELIAEKILIPLHPWVVWLVTILLPAFETYVGNEKPTHEDAGVVIYPLTMFIIGVAAMSIWIGVTNLLFGSKKNPTVRGR